MKCQEFTQIVAELARNQRPGSLMDAAQRTEGLAHAEGCASCAARLNDERTLTAGLRALAASDERLLAPAHTETLLLAAFRQQAAPMIVKPQRAATKHWPRWAWAAAAAILLVLGLVVLRALQDGTSSPEVIVEAPLPTPATTIPAARRETTLDQQATRDQQPVSRLERVAQRTGPRRHNDQRAPRLLIRDSITLYANDSEVASDFFPLTYGANAPPLESGHLIRVQMPRSALVAYGLPVNPERADVPVKADLLVGEDGLARAIRFVR